MGRGDYLSNREKLIFSEELPLLMLFLIPREKEEKTSKLLLETFDEKNSIMKRDGLFTNEKKGL